MKPIELARIRTAKTGRCSSWDTTGRNVDGWTIPARSSRVLADIQGPGVITHIWMTQPNAFLRNGSSIHESNTGGYQTSYVHHLDNPVRFEKEIKVTIEHGHGNHLGNEMASVAYWYADQPAAAIAIPPMAKRQRVPKVDGKWVISDELRWTGHEVKIDPALVAAARAGGSS